MGETSRYRIFVPVLKVRSIVWAPGSYSTSSINVEAGENFSSFASFAEPVATDPMAGNIPLNQSKHKR